MAEKTKSRVYREWDDGFVVRRMTGEDAEKVILWWVAVCPTSVDLQVVLDVRGDCDEEASDGFYVGELNGELIASKIELVVADGLRYGSMFYVDERYRGSGLGRRINDVARDVSERASNRCLVAIDAHSELEAVNSRRGYKTAFPVTQFTGKVQPDGDSGRSGSTIQQLNDVRRPILVECSFVQLLSQRMFSVKFSCTAPKMDYSGLTT